MPTDPRPLEERLTEYRDMLRGLIPQLKEVEARLAPGVDPTPLRDGMRFYGLIATDLTKVLNGEAMERFRVEGILP
jgi:hypothetical protein